MGNSELQLYVFIDAFGWELYKRDPWFLEGIITDKKPLETVFGYSSACIPSIITGRSPSEHGYWSSFYYAPRTSPFGRVSGVLRYFPVWLSGKGRIRRYISNVLKGMYGFSGYFSVYSVPFEYLPYFDYQEKNDIFLADNLNGYATVFSILRERNVQCFCGTRHSDAVKFRELLGVLQKKDVSFAYLHLGELDALLHLNGKTSAAVTGKLKEYDRYIRKALSEAEKRYAAVNLTVFSDHGMKDVVASYDLIRSIDSLGLSYGRDYAAFYDATMARFWFFNDLAREKIVSLLDRIEEGDVLSEKELRSMGVYFTGQKYGELIFLVKPGVMINPSFMGGKILPGMHGYRPDDPDSFALIMSNEEIGEKVRTIRDVFYGIFQGVGCGKS